MASPSVPARLRNALAHRTSMGESARVAEPWMGSGACEQLYHQLLVESEFRQQGLRSGSVEREAFVAVLLRRLSRLV